MDQAEEVHDHSHARNGVAHHEHENNTVLDETQAEEESPHYVPHNGHSHDHLHSDVHHLHSPFSGPSHVTDTEIDEERQHFRTVKAAFRYYRKHCMKKISRQTNHYLALSRAHRNKVPSFSTHLDALRQCTDVNYQFILRILEQIPFDEPVESAHSSTDSTPPVGSFQMDKVHTTLRMFMRDWSREGVLERGQAYQPLLDAVQKYVPIRDSHGNPAKVLNPGSGLGRLPWELARMGYTSFGNEFSLYMLFASNFVLNCCDEADMFKIYPWIGQASNNMSSADKLAGISIPDVSPSKDLSSSSSSSSSDNRFGMVAGDFLEVFDRDGSWSAVLTCFFIDTARNILEYIEHIFGLLKPGAFWFNLGPLLYHFADRSQEGCTELTYEELKEAMIRTGFVFREERCDIPCQYVQNARSMMRSEYRCMFFVCQKPNQNEGSSSDRETAPVAERGSLTAA